MPYLIALLLTASFLSAQSERVKVWRILDSYNKVYGGGRDAKGMSAILVEGRQTQDGQTFDFTMRKKRPNSIRYQMESGENSILLGYNGRVGWQQVFVDGQRTVTDLEGETLNLIKEEADFDGPLLRHIRFQDGVVIYERTERVMEQMADVLLVTSLSGAQSRYYVSHKSSHILKRELLSADGTIKLQTIYSDYQVVGGFPFAHLVENFVDGEMVSRVEIEHIRVNPGVLSFYFEKPKD